jgi:hypothetical protein
MNREKFFQAVARNNWTLYMLLGISCLNILMSVHHKYHQSLWILRNYNLLVRLMRRKKRRVMILFSNADS